MLVFKTPQLTAFKHASRAAFEKEMAAHAHEFAPRLAKALSPEALHAAVQRTIARAESHGFTTRGPVRLYLDLVLQLGIGFDVDPGTPWAAEILGRDDFVGEMHKAEALHQAFCVYVDAIAEPDGAPAHAALERMAAFDLPISEAALPTYLVSLYPEKCNAIGGANLDRLLQNALARARDVHGFIDPPSRVMMAVLAFALGHACDRDPFYPFLQTTLEARAPAEARAERIGRRAMIWFRAALRDGPRGIFDADA